jgi:electron transport complex protein RnfG
VREAIRLGGRLFLIALLAGVLLGATYFVTKEPIAQQQAMQAAAARGKVIVGMALPEEGVALSGNVRGSYVTDAGGHVVEVMASGYGGEFLVTVGVAPDGAITGVVIGANKETVGLGKNAEKPEFTGQFIGKNGAMEIVKNNATGNQIDALTGATITSRAVMNAVNEAREFALQRGGAAG